MFELLLALFILSCLDFKKIGRIAHSHIRFWWMLIVGVALQAVYSLPASFQNRMSTFFFILVVVIRYGLLISFFVINACRHPVLYGAGLGAACNMIAMLANGGKMPITGRVLNVVSEAQAHAYTVGQVHDSVLMGEGVHLSFLGNVIYIRGITPHFLSLGDVLLIACIGAFFFLRTWKRPHMATAAKQIASSHAAMHHQAHRQEKPMPQPEPLSSTGDELPMQPAHPENPTERTWSSPSGQYDFSEPIPPEKDE